MCFIGGSLKGAKGKVDPSIRRHLISQVVGGGHILVLNHHLLMYTLRMIKRLSCLIKRSISKLWEIREILLTILHQRGCRSNQHHLRYRHCHRHHRLLLHRPSLPRKNLHHHRDHHHQSRPRKVLCHRHHLRHLRKVDRHHHRNHHRLKSGHRVATLWKCLP